ncbi:MAG TPA: hypothetical protein VMN78_07455 [Longimicrobiales bacterium]|nr:hypothetical protein [Longimicrobiales bacterium]
MRRLLPEWLGSRLTADLPWRARLNDDRIVVILPLVLAFVTYANSLYNGFAFDDTVIIQLNTRVHQFFDLGAIWLTPYWPYAHGDMFGLYRPLTIFAYAIQWALGEGQAFLFHFVNVLMHVAVTYGVFRLLRALAFDAPASAFGAAVFAVHPVHVEAVANVVGQAEMIGAGAVVAACILYLEREGEGLRLPRTLAIAALYLGGMLAKENAIVLPALIVAVDLAQRHMRRLPLWRRSWVDPAALLALLSAVAVAYLALRLDVLGSIGGSDAGPALPFLKEEDRVYSALRAWPEFARLLFWPMKLAADYAPAVILPAYEFTPMVTLGLFLLVATVVLALLTPWRPRLGLPAAWFLICILPVSNLLLPIGVLIAERTLYMPSVAVSLVAAALAGFRHKPSARRLLAVGAVAVLLAFTVRTITRNPVWYSTDTVLRSLLDTHPESYRAQWRAAVREVELGNYARSHYHWELGYRLWPRNSAYTVDYANFHLNYGNPARAAALAEAARAADPNAQLAGLVLAAARLKLRDFDGALAVADELIPEIGLEPRIARMRARALTGLGRSTEALAAWRLAMSTGPSSAADWIVYARALQMDGRLRDALKALDAAEARIRDDEPESTTAVAAGRRQIRAQMGE